MEDVVVVVDHNQEAVGVVVATKAEDEAVMRTPDEVEVVRTTKVANPQVSLEVR